MATTQDSVRTGAVRERLAQAASLREAAPGEEIAGVAPAWVARPSGTDEVAALLSAAHAAGLAVVARGAGTQQGFGAPPQRLDLVIETAGLDEIVEYAPHDLVLRVGAGVRLDAIAELLDEHGQRLAIDPPRRGTVAGALAVGAAGPLRLSHGSPRDIVIGMTCVRADGVVAHSGGKVVKNVAGYDLGKLFAGSYGTLGVITELTFRLHPLPEASRWVGGLLDVDVAERVLEALAQGQGVPAAVEFDVPVDGHAGLWVQFDGTAAGLDSRVHPVCELFTRAGARDVAELDEAPFWWGAEPPGAVLLKVTHVIGAGARLAGSLAQVAREAGVQAAYRGSPLVGTAWVGVDAPDRQAFAAFVESAREHAAQVGGTLVVLAAPPDRREAVDPWGPVAGLHLMRAIKDQFDPEGVLAPGRFVGGI